MHQCLQRGELRRDPERHGVCVLVGEVCGVDLGFELDRLDRGPFQPKGLGALAAAVAADALHLVAARQRVGVVLQCDAALHSAQHHEAAFDQLGRGGQRHHGPRECFCMN
jgi:hypothetical protein